MLEVVLGIGLLIVVGGFAYMSAHMVEEKKQGKRIPLPWEKEKEMGYGAGSYSRKPAKKAKKKKKTAMKKKKK